MTCYSSTDALNDRVIKMLVKYGMQLHKASAVLPHVIAAEDMESMVGRWNERADGFVSDFLSAIEARARAEAVRWIDAHSPGHFARRVLAGEDKGPPPQPAPLQVKDLHEQMSSARDTLERAVQRYLRQSGWKYTCSTPGSLWLWEKALPDGRVVVVSSGTAVSIQEAIEPPPEIGDEAD